MGTKLNFPGLTPSLKAGLIFGVEGSLVSALAFAIEEKDDQGSCDESDESAFWERPERRHAAEPESPN